MKSLPNILLFLPRLIRRIYRGYPILKIAATLYWASIIVWWFSLPRHLFDDPTSAVLEDRKGELLGARISSDGQWRFPAADTVPFRFATALVTFEDRRFYQHPGVDPVGIARAISQNLRNRDVVSGGSTLSMQVIRLSRGEQKRNIWNKLVEALLALRLEVRYSKQEILAMYASNAPFGGNVVGLDAAAWRYYGRRAGQLSWAEASTLAVLPNAPGMVHPGRNRKTLKEKRDRLLDRLEKAGHLDAQNCALAKMEPLPGNPLALPNHAPHLLDQVVANDFRRSNAPTLMRTTLDLWMQERATEVVEHHSKRLQANGVYNSAALIVDVKTGDVLAYVGNVKNSDPAHGASVDVIRSRRSTGSILKPFLYASMLSDGEMLPDMLVTDIPTYFGSYSPKNFDHEYDGAVPASAALARSLNVPAIRMLSDYGQPRFYANLKKMGMSTLDKPASHYGLSLVLGGAEVSPWDLAGMYSGMARTVNEFHDNNGKISENVNRSINYQLANSTNGRETHLTDKSLLSPAACYQTLQAMVEVARPGEERRWQQFSSSRRVAWKTGTSYGHRDAWAVGCTPDYVIVVWAGNADGEGRPGLLGSEAAAPLLFELFDMLPKNERWFQAPYDDMKQISVCRQSGHRASAQCPDQDTVWVAEAGLRTAPCPYHKTIHLDITSSHRVHGDCYSPADMVQAVRFVLPPVQEAFYKRRHSEYETLPPFAPECAVALEEMLSGRSMELVYPRTRSRIVVPVNLDGSLSSTVFEVAHRNTSAQIYWHLDNEYLGMTETIHQFALNPTPGVHVLTLVDGDGERLVQEFEAAGDEKDNTGM